MHISEYLTNRRGFLAAGGAGAALLLAGGREATAELTPPLREYETANEKLVMDFCATWESLDIEKISAYFDDKIVFRMIDSTPFVEGKEAMVAAMGGFLSTRKSAKFEVLRSTAMGNLVLNERIDYFGREDGEDAFHITGIFVVKNSKIAEWRDYMMPQT